MNDLDDMIVIGTGPAGAEAAVTAAEFGLKVTVVDEAAAPGGQVYRKPAPGNDLDAAPQGQLLRQRLSSSTARVLNGQCVWNVTRRAAEGSDPVFELSTLGPVGPRELRARAMVIATGATERFYARPGWTLPGVVGLGAATVLVKSFGVLPGRRVVVAGAGPLLSLVAHLILQGGGTVAAVADINPLGNWIRLLPAMASRPDLLARGLGWQLELLGHRVPVYRGFDLQKISGVDSVTGATLVRLDGGRKIDIEADAVCMGHGLVPSTDISRLLNAKQAYRAEDGGWVAALDAEQRTSVPGLYAAGDGARLAGAAAAPLQGRLAALTAIGDLRGSTPALQREVARVRRSLNTAGRFGTAMAQLCPPRAQAMSSVSDHTIVCRCEDISAGTIRAAVSAGSRTLNALKSTTRCGMGPCGGRSCGASASALMECAGVGIEEIGQATARAPLRPISLSAVAGEFSYSDIPLPEPSPV